MYLQAASDLHLDLARSFFVGDRVKDVAPALALGGTGILVRTGYGREEEGEVDAGTLVVDTVLDAALLIVGRE
jgi:D-glycero-D-manno-heptose 1,7-bisphosphate phosphatase